MIRRNWNGIAVRAVANLENTSSAKLALCPSGKMLGMPVSTSKTSKAAKTAKPRATANKSKMVRLHLCMASVMRRTFSVTFPTVPSSRRGWPVRQKVQRRQKRSFKRQTVGKRRLSNNHTTIMQTPMKKPKSRKGLSTEARFAKKEIAVVADVTREALPAWYTVQHRRSTRKWCTVADSFHKSTYTKKTSAPKPTMRKIDRNETTCTCRFPVMSAAAM
mmetsp:Transcript_125830/g.361846  ORF Transcript_125830/g.361846 Transcript_125830/m.361846 type:complete len:218 (-) Transcript_125830:278-931(-)